MYIELYTQIKIQRYRQIDVQIDRNIDRQMYRDIDIQIDRYINRYSQNVDTPCKERDRRINIEIDR